MKKISTLFGILLILASIYILVMTNLFRPAPLESWLMIGGSGLLGIFYIINAIRGKFNWLSKFSYILTFFIFVVGFITLWINSSSGGSHGEIIIPLNHIAQSITLVCLFVSLITIVTSQFSNKGENRL